MSDFIEKIARAKGAGDRWVETSADIIKLIYPRGLGTNHGEPIEHFCYQGILVCEYGRSEQIETKMNEPMGKRIHGDKEATIISGG